MYSPVLWASVINSIRSLGVETMLFIGPGKALANLARRDSKLVGWADSIDIGTVATGEDFQRAKEMFA